MKEIAISKPELKLIYETIGGEVRLGQILDRFYEQMATDTMIGFFFYEKDLKLIASKQKEFLMRAMGATPSYTGRSPAQAHEALPPIRRGMFDRRLRILEEVLKAEGLAEKDIRTWVSFEEAFREAVEH